MSIQVANLFKSYGKHPAVKGISFNARPGRVLGFLGPNGAGKSTTLKILSGSIPLTAGQVSICGLDIQQNSLATRRYIGYLPENNPLYLDMYVHEALTFVAEMHHIVRAHERIAEVISLTGLEAEQQKKI
ncbi:MAG: ATP-binding cassette domain-containing protein, partial [Parapedobacter sp.]